MFFLLCSLGKKQYVHFELIHNNKDTQQMQLFLTHRAVLLSLLPLHKHVGQYQYQTHPTRNITLHNEEDIKIQINLN